ncbi:Arc family DNA-binding protein [Rhizobium ruizarguesonis]
MMKSDDENRVSNISPFGLRLLPDLKRRVEEAARTNGRSLNAEIAYRLEASLETDEDKKSASAANSLLRSSLHNDPVRELERRVENLEAKVASFMASK